MIIQPHQYTYYSEHNNIIICGDNVFLIDHILHKVSKYKDMLFGYEYVFSNDNLFNRNRLIIRNDSRWSKIIKKKDYIYIPCYNWNFQSSEEILKSYFTDIKIIKYIHYNSSYNMMKLLQSLSQEETDQLIQNDNIHEDEQSIYNEILTTLI